MGTRKEKHASSENSAVKIEAVDESDEPVNDERYYRDFVRRRYPYKTHTVDSIDREYIENINDERHYRDFVRRRHLNEEQTDGLTDREYIAFVKDQRTYHSLLNRHNLSYYEEFELVKYTMRKEDILKRSAVQIEATDELTDRKEIVPVNDTTPYSNDNVSDSFAVKVEATDVPTNREVIMPVNNETPHSNDIFSQTYAIKIEETDVPTNSEEIEFVNNEPDDSDFEGFIDNNEKKDVATNRDKMEHSNEESNDGDFNLIDNNTENDESSNRFDIEPVDARIEKPEELSMKKETKEYANPRDIKMEIDKRKTQRNVQSLDIGYGITLIDVPSEIKYEATRWDADERVDALKKNTFPDQFMLASDIVHVHEKGAATNPLDCSLFSEGESITVNVVLPSVNDINLKYFQYKAAVRFQMQWEFLDIEILEDNKGKFRKNKIESICIFIQSIKERIMLSEEETQYVNSKDEQIRVKFPQNSVTKSQQIDFKVYPVNVDNINWTKDVNEMGIAKISECLFGSHVEFQVPVVVQLPLKSVGTWVADDTDMDYIVFKVNDDWSLDFLDTKPEIKDGIASFTVNSFSGVGCVVTPRNNPDVLENVYRSIQAAYMFTKTCKILFFVRKQTSLSSMMIILECVPSEKMEEIIINRKAIYDFDNVKEWTSRDIDMIPDRTVIKVDVRGKFSMPKEAKIKSPAIYCNPFGRENFNRFQVELSQRVGGSLFGILSFRNTKHVIDEIFYDPSSRTKVPNKGKSGYRIMRNEREVKTSPNKHSKGINKL